MRYPVRLTKDDNDTYLATFPDVPEAVTFGNTREDAFTNATEALLSVFDALMRDRKNIPAPSTKGTVFVELPALETTKLELYRAMREGEVGKAELAKRLDWHLPQVDRVLNVRHGSQLDQLEAAFGALGKRLVLTVVDAEGRAAIPGAVVTATHSDRATGRHAAAGVRAHSRLLKRAAKKR